MRRFRRALVLTAVVALIAACAPTGDSPTTTLPDDTTTVPATGAVIAEFETSDGVRYRILVEGEAADHVRAAHASGEAPGIPNGVINPGDGGVNTGHEWHITEVEFVDMTIELCDGTAGYIDELGYEAFVDQHGERFCPWSAELVDLIEPN